MERITAESLGRSCHSPAQVRAVRFGHIDVDDAIFTAVEERRMAAFGEIQELVGQDEIARLIVAVQGAYRRRRQDSRDAQALQAQDIGPVIDEMRRNGMCPAVAGQEDEFPVFIRPLPIMDGPVKGIHIVFMDIG